MSLFEFIGSRFRKLILEPSVKAQERSTQTITVIPLARPTIIDDHEPGVNAQERPETVSVITGPVVINDYEPGVTAKERQETVYAIPGPAVVINDHEPSVTAKERRETVSVIQGPVVINDLPPETLAEIFVLATTFFTLGCTINIDDCDCGIKQLQHCGPLNLVPVCRYWREVALSIQTLWASSDATGFTPKAWAYWSGFAKSSPLRLRFAPDLRRGFDYDENKHWDPQRRSEIFKRRLEKSKAMLHQFAACADRWDCLYFECYNHQVAQAIADMLHTTTSRSPLRKISINFVEDDRKLSKIIEKLVSAIASFPSLREFVYQDCTGRFNTLPRSPDFPWHALENIYIRIAVDLQECIQWLMQCTSARHVTLFRYGYRDITAGPSKLVRSTLPKLKSLTISNTCYPDTFLGYFTLPSLVSLEIQNLVGFSPALEEFLVRSRCPLHIFKISPGYAMKPDKIIACLSAPYLQTVPNVVASISIHDWHDIMQQRSESDILRILPRFTAWDCEWWLGSIKIGWRSLKAP